MRCQNATFSAYGSVQLVLPEDRRLATFTGKLTLAAALTSAAPFRGSVSSRQLAEQLREYLGSTVPLMPYPLAIGAARS